LQHVLLTVQSWSTNLQKKQKKQWVVCCFVFYYSPRPVSLYFAHASWNLSIQLSWVVKLVGIAALQLHPPGSLANSLFLLLQKGCRLCSLLSRMEMQVQGTISIIVIAANLGVEALLEFSCQHGLWQQWVAGFKPPFEL
jgi:hypothetical protein